MVTLDNTLDEILAGQPNQAEYVRKAISLYHGGITPDSIKGFRNAFEILQNEQKSVQIRLNEFEQRFIELYEMVESTKNMMEELANR